MTKTLHALTDAETRSLSSIPKHFDVLLRGGRMTKVAGVAASFAPALGGVAMVMATSATALIMGASQASAQAATCMPDAVTPGAFLCMEVGDNTTQSLSGGVGDLTVATIDQLMLDVTTGTAIDLSGINNITFTDANMSSITGSFFGLNVSQVSEGGIYTDKEISVTSNGTISGGAAGVYIATVPGLNTSITADLNTVTARNVAVEILNTHGNDDTTVTVNTATARNGVDIDHFASGAATLTSTGAITGTNGAGIIVTTGGFSAGASNGTDVTINVNDVIGQRRGILATHVGSGELQITATGTVSSSDGEAIRAANGARVTPDAEDIFAPTTNANQGTNLTITAVDVADLGSNRRRSPTIRTANYGTGATTITTTGTVSSTNGGGIFARNGALAFPSTGPVAGLAPVYGEYGYAAGIEATGQSVFVNPTYSAPLTLPDPIAPTVVGTDLTITANTVTVGQTAIDARNYGSGMLSVTADSVTSERRHGIDVRNGVGLFQVAQEYSKTRGLYHDNFVNYSNPNAPRYSVPTAGTDLKITVGDVAAFSDGVRSDNSGTGATTVSVTGHIATENGYGIYARNGKITDSSYVFSKYYGRPSYAPRVRAVEGTDLTVTANSLTTGGTGIYAFNQGTGSTSITASGKITAGRYGVDAAHGVSETVQNYRPGPFAAALSFGAPQPTYSAAQPTLGTVLQAGTDLTISTAEIDAYQIGINARNNGTGATTITATGAVSGENRYGIYATNGRSGPFNVNQTTYGYARIEGFNSRPILNATTDLTITAADVTGRYGAIRADNNGSGALKITANGNLSSTAGVGVWADNGRRAAPEGFGQVTALPMRQTMSASVNAIDASLSAGYISPVMPIVPTIQGLDNLITGTDLDVTTKGTVNAAAGGIFARNFGTGNTTVTSTGAITGINGIQVFNGIDSNNLTVSAGAITAEKTAIEVLNAGKGATSITTTGDITAGQAGIVAYNATAEYNFTSSFGKYYYGGGVPIAAPYYGGPTMAGSFGGDIVAPTTTPATATSLTINVANVTGAYYGILATQLGTGDVSVTSSGTISAPGGDDDDNAIAGVLLMNGATGGNATISANNVAGGLFGLASINASENALSITTTGTVTSDAVGVFAVNGGAQEFRSLQVLTNPPEPSVYGITGGDVAYGLPLTTSELARKPRQIEPHLLPTPVINASDYGVGSRGSDLTISVKDVAATGLGVFAQNGGNGATTITSTGTVTGALGGILVSNATIGTDLKVSAANIAAGNHGITAFGNGTGSVSVTSSGTITAQAGYGVRVTNSTGQSALDQLIRTVTPPRVMATPYPLSIAPMATFADVVAVSADPVLGTDLNVSVKDVTSGGAGISTNNSGTGNTNITVTGTVTTAAIGIDATNATRANDLTINAANVTAGLTGINAIQLGSGATSVNTTGTIAGTGLNGINIFNTSTATDITLNTASVIGGLNGINLSQNGTGATSVTATGAVSGALTGANAAFSHGVNIQSSASSLATTVALNAATGATGVNIDAAGTGAVKLTATGALTGTVNQGADVQTGGASTSLDVNVAAVSGKTTGLNVDHDGSGALGVTATGAVTGETTGLAVNAASTSGAATIAMTDVTGGTGAALDLNGNGAASVTATGTLTGTVNQGADVQTGGASTSLDVSVAAVSGKTTGLNVDHNGSGALDITATGAVTGGTTGLDVLATSTSGAATITVADVTGGTGAALDLDGNGNAAFTATGALTGTTGAGLYLDLDLGARDAVTDVSLASVAGKTIGVDIDQASAGTTNVTATGAISGGTTGLKIDTSENSGDVTVAVTDVTGGAGVSIRSIEDGDVSFTATGAVTGTVGMGVEIITNTQELPPVFMRPPSGGLIVGNLLGSAALAPVVPVNVPARTTADSTLDVTVGDVTGATTAVYVGHESTGDATVTVNGDITGTTGGVVFASQNNAKITLTLADGATVTTAGGTAISDTLGDATLTLNTGASVDGLVLLDTGSDALVLAGGTFSAATVFDGGDDASVADGFEDIISLSADTALTDANFINWETINATDAKLSFTGTTFNAGDTNSGATLNLIGTSAVSMQDGFALMGALNIGADSTLSASGATSITGDVANAGAIDLSDGTAGDSLTITGNLGGAGTISLDTSLGDDTAATDSVAISGTAVASELDLNIVDRTGGQTTDGIKLLSVGGDISGTFTMNGDYVDANGEQALVAGAFAYTLDQSADGDVTLNSSQPHAGVAGYELYASALLELSAPGSLSTRLNGVSGNSGTTTREKLSFIGQTPSSSGWVSFQHGQYELAPSASATGATAENTFNRIDAGLTFAKLELDGSDVLFGANVFYVTQDGSVASDVGSGMISSQSSGLNLTATWFNSAGLYVDGQLSFGSITSDITAELAPGTSVTANGGTSQSISLEVGKEFDIAGYTITPQVQVSQVSVDFDTFTGVFGEEVRLQDATSTDLRIGASVQREVNFGSSTAQLFANVNAFKSLDGANAIDVAGTSFNADMSDWSADLTVGGSMDVTDGLSLYGNITAGSSLGEGASETYYTTQIGVEYNF